MEREIAACSECGHTMYEDQNLSRRYRKWFFGWHYQYQHYFKRICCLCGVPWNPVWRIENNAANL